MGIEQLGGLRPGVGVGEKRCPGWGEPGPIRKARNKLGRGPWSSPFSEEDEEQDEYSQAVRERLCFKRHECAQRAKQKTSPCDEDEEHLHGLGLALGLSNYVDGGEEAD